MLSPPPGPIYFISDLHLSHSMPKTAAAFEYFMAHTTQDARAVFILGDLFEYWIGDGMVEHPFTQRILRCMRARTARGDSSYAKRAGSSAPFSLYVMRGNRDFLLGPRFAAQAGAQLLPDPYVLEAFGQRIVLSHGDHLCTADRSYQRFRRFVHHPLVQRFFLAWPFHWRLKLANWIRAQSDQARSRRSLYSKEPLSIFSAPLGEGMPIDPQDVTPDAVAHLFTHTHTDTLIHGHTHRPAHHLQGGHHRWVLSDWDLEETTHAKRGNYIRWDEEGIRAIDFEYT